MKIDKQEKMWKHRKKFKHVASLLEKEFANQEGLGLCHIVWARKKELLKELYNIDWQSPAELNPHIKFD